ncbi:MAG: hypothetical protein GX749_09370 [Ruminococcaceae bacterium]|nr:hypothetical protein [Oscillospiraceae bacterium]
MKIEKKVNYGSLIVKYIITVLLFAVIYSLIAVLLLSFSLSPAITNVIAAAIAVISMMNLMKIIGPWIDKRFEKNE